MAILVQTHAVVTRLPSQKKLCFSLLESMHDRANCLYGYVWHNILGYNRAIMQKLLVCLRYETVVSA